MILASSLAFTQSWLHAQRRVHVVVSSDVSETSNPSAQGSVHRGLPLLSLSEGEILLTEWELLLLMMIAEIKVLKVPRLAAYSLRLRRSLLLV